MPNFTNTPPEHDRPKNLKLIRTPIKCPMKGIITCDDVVGCNTHFFGGRTTPCEAPDCPACNDGFPIRWHGYLTVWFPTDCIQVLYEFTDTAAPAILAYRTQHGTLRNAKITATRHKPIPNGRVNIKLERIDVSQWSIPSPPNVTEILLRMWEMPLKSFAARRKLEGMPQLSAVPEVCDRMRGRMPKNGHPKQTELTPIAETIENALPRDLRGPFDKPPKKEPTK
jgi:hypothetical protein